MKGAHFYADATIAELYDWFAGEVAGSSPTWVRVCRWISDSHTLDDLLDRLPGIKRQPNLFLAALRLLEAPLPAGGDGSGATEPGGELADWVREHWDEVEQVVLTHATQTNEPGRCATLAPVLAAIEGPIALIEVGMSAGLCLTPDLYGYRYHRDGQTRTVWPDGAATASGAEPPVFDCEVSAGAGAVELPPALPEVVWRGGIDLNPLDPADPRDANWLRALIWPDQPDRERRLTAALRVAGTVEVNRVRGDALAELPALVDRAPREATVVVIHSAVLAYLSRDQRGAFVDLMNTLGTMRGKRRDKGVRWLSNEGLRVLPGVTERLAAPDERPGDFVLALDGIPLARTGGHGQRLHWLQGGGIPPPAAR